MNNTKLIAQLTLLAAAVTLTACGGDSNNSDSDDVATELPVVETPQNEASPGDDDSRHSVFTLGVLPDTQGGSDATGQAHVAIHPMDEVLKHQLAAGVNLVIPVGDLTDKGSAVEWEEWTSVARPYKEQGMEFLPVMGNHELNYSYTTGWINAMREFIPEDAVHMPGYEWINYYVIRENVLMIGLAYYNLPLAINWIEDVVATHRADVDHIVVASHDGLIGAKYGQTREQIVEGTKDDDWVYSVADEIRAFFAEHDVIYVQGHEHQYQRSLIARDTAQTSFPSGSTPEGGNYRMNVYTQILSGNASYKGYEFRYGERELVQMIVAQKNATMSGGSDHFDVNSSWLRFDNDRVDYASYYAEHTAQNNNSDQDFDADWHLMDKFSRTINRCETVIYPNNIPEGTRAVMVFQPEYLTDYCLADDGSMARLVGGSNDTFNRTDSRTRDMGYTPGFSRAETLTDLTRLAYQWLYQYHESWTPNLNSGVRVIPDGEAGELVIPEVTVDLKEHVTLSWTPATETTVSDILIVSGTQNQTGVYQGDYGEPKDMQADTGLTVKDGDGDDMAKPAVVLPASATGSWDISDAVADPYAVAFTASENVTGDGVILARRAGDSWQPLADTGCIIEGIWLESYITSPPARSAACEGSAVLGYDADDNIWWSILTEDTELALISR
ncbi:metallophosphoesterase [uncultured Thalassolituus sp.]|uniref:metallophosphoesterase family protein n=1 Tax=uncultured Thalassolituus sp. TaxID=285273 RepID=UPI002635EEA2|nr:metallophosphoesterase [uncultured Thalassolituus sp.]